MLARLLPEIANGQESTAWRIETRGGYVRIKTPDSKSFLDANGGGGNIYLNSNTLENDNFLWKREDAGGGWFYLRPKVNPSVFLDSGVGHKEPYFQKKFERGNPNLKWKFIPLTKNDVLIVSLGAEHRVLGRVARGRTRFRTRLRVIASAYESGLNELKQKIKSEFSKNDFAKLEKLMDSAFKSVVINDVGKKEDEEDDGKKPNDEPVEECMERKGEERGRDPENYRWACYYEAWGKKILKEFQDYLEKLIVEKASEEWQKRIEKPVNKWVKEREKSVGNWVRNREKAARKYIEGRLPKLPSGLKPF